MSTCPHCLDTGSLSKQLIGYLDCPHCEVATERTVFERWAVKNVPGCDDLNVAWVIYRHGMASALDAAKNLSCYEWDMYDGMVPYEGGNETPYFRAQDVLDALKPHEFQQEK